MSDKADLSDVTTVELIEELKRRSKSMVIGFDPLAERSVFLVLRHGPKLFVAGLLRTLTLASDNELQNDPRDREPNQPEFPGSSNL